jgi:hypothetical protein
MNIFAYFRKLFASEPTAQDSRLPLKINFKSTVTFEINPLVSAITRGAMINAPLDNLKVLKVNAISSINIEGMEDKKIYRFYFNKLGSEKRLFLQVLTERDEVEKIEEILFCSSLTEPPEGEEDIAFFSGDNEEGLGGTSYSFSREDLYAFLPKQEVDKRLSASGDEDGVEYSRVETEEAFMPAFTGIETVIFDANGTTGERNEIMNLMPHSRALEGIAFEELIVAFWVTSSKNGKDITTEDQLPLAEYIFAIKLEQANIKVI